MLKAYKINDVLVFATRGTEAKLLAAPKVQSAEYWRDNAAEWVALRAERTPEFDHLINPNQTEPYLHASS